MSQTLSTLRNPRDRKTLDDCADLHLQEIPGGFLPTFGRYFLRQLYDYLASSKGSFLIVAVEGNRTLGFICGSYGEGSLYKTFALRKGVLIGIPILMRLFRKGTLTKIREVISYPAGEEYDHLPGSEILNFCVSREAQGRGVGRRLFQELCEEYRRCDIDEIRIVTGSDQARAQRFYEHMGAQRKGELQVHDGHVSFVYTYTIGVQ